MENQIIVALLFSISNQTTIVNNASSAVAKKNTHKIYRAASKWGQKNF